MALETTQWDTTKYLKSKEDIAAYLEAVFEDGDPALVGHALGEIARAEGMTQVAKAAGLSRESLYRALSSTGNPELATVLKVMKALGLTLSVKPVDGQPDRLAAAS
jgi:probable addiction module antidote protein